MRSSADHQIGLSYTWVKQALQVAGLVKRRRRHRKRRERRPLPGMMLHIDGSEHHWFQDERKHDLIVILDDSDIYYAQLAPGIDLHGDGRATTVIEQKGLFCSLIPTAEPISGTHRRAVAIYERPTQVGRAMKNWECT